MCETLTQEQNACANACFETDEPALNTPLENSEDPQVNNSPTDLVPTRTARWQPAWPLLARNSLLALGFAVLILGAGADIAHYLDGHSTPEAPSAALVQAGAAPVDAAPSTIEVDANPAPLATIDILPTPDSGSLFDPVFNSHTVAPGDVLYTIAARYGTTTQVLIELNAIEDPNRIEVGQVLVLPESAVRS
jgi:LysM domain